MSNVAALTKAQLAMLAAAALKLPGRLYVAGSGRSQLAARLAYDGWGEWAPPGPEQRGGTFRLSNEGMRRLLVDY